MGDPTRAPRRHHGRKTRPPAPDGAGAPLSSDEVRSFEHVIDIAREEAPALLALLDLLIEVVRVDPVLAAHFTTVWPPELLSAQPELAIEALFWLEAARARQ